MNLKKTKSYFYVVDNCKYSRIFFSFAFAFGLIALPCLTFGLNSFVPHWKDVFSLSTLGKAIKPKKLKPKAKKAKGKGKEFLSTYNKSNQTNGTLTPLVHPL